MAVLTNDLAVIHFWTLLSTRVAIEGCSKGSKKQAAADSDGEQNRVIKVVGSVLVTRGDWSLQAHTIMIDISR